jgi:hypothetical protein
MKTEMIKLWQDNNVEKCVMNFSCGGDSMNDTEFNLYDKDDNVIQCQELTGYFENQVYNEVNFYEASDGHYQGEYGTVTITLEDDGDGELYFSYDKQSNSEWSEQFTENVDVELTDEEVEFVKTKVLNIVGGDDGGVINYKEDCILTDEEEKVGEEMLGRLSTIADEHEFKNEEGEPEGWWNFRTGESEENNSIRLSGNTLTLSVSRTFLVIKEEEW